MGFLDYLLIVIAILMIIEAVLEARRKNWLAFAISLCFLLVVLYVSRGVYVYIWNKIAPAPTAPATP